MCQDSNPDCTKSDCSLSHSLVPSMLNTASTFTEKLFVILQYDPTFNHFVNLQDLNTENGGGCCFE